MNFSPQQIDQIVKSVVDRLRAVAKQDSPPAVQIQSPMVHSISDRIVSVSVLEAVPKNTKSVVVAGKAIITPAARDWLNENQITLSQQTNIGSSPVTARSKVNVIANSRQCSVAKAIAARFKLTIEYLPEQKDVVARVASFAKADQRTIVITKSNHQLAIELNRHAKTAAIAPVSLGHLAGCLDQTDCNVVVFSAIEHNHDEINAMVQRWLGVAAPAISGGGL
jgi:hypothetical protein